MRSAIIASALAFFAGSVFAQDDLSWLTAEKCQSLVFPAVFPPTPAQQRCDELTGGGSGRGRFSSGDLPVILDRSPDGIDDLTAEQCRNSAFIDIYPPSPAEVRCNEILGRENLLGKRDFLDTLTAEKCSKMAFLAVMPPSAAELRCRELLGGAKVKRVARWEA